MASVMHASVSQHLQKIQRYLQDSKIALGSRIVRSSAVCLRCPTNSMSAQHEFVETISVTGCRSMFHLAHLRQLGPAVTMM